MELWLSIRASAYGADAHPIAALELLREIPRVEPKEYR
jgi:hypothetical protein